MAQAGHTARISAATHLRCLLCWAMTYIFKQDELVEESGNETHCSGTRQSSDDAKMDAPIATQSESWRIPLRMHDRLEDTFVGWQGRRAGQGGLRCARRAGGRTAPAGSWQMDNMQKAKRSS